MITTITFLNEESYLYWHKVQYILLNISYIDDSMQDCEKSSA